MLTFPEAETPETLRRQVHQMQAQAWPTNGSSASVNLDPVHDPVLRPLSMLLVDDGTVLAALDVLFKEIDHTGLHLIAAGLSTVVTPLPTGAGDTARSL